MLPKMDWVEEIIRIVGAENIVCVVDVGANIGDVTYQLSHYFPKSSLVCIEPHKDSYQKLSNRFKDYKNVSCIQAALGACEGSADLQIYTNNLCNTLVPNLREPWVEFLGVESVNIFTLDQIANLHKLDRIDILKIDVEGYELNVLKGAILLLENQQIRFVYAEVGFHPNQRHQYFNELSSFLSALDYDLCGFYEVHKDGRRGQYISYCNALFMIRPRRFRCAL